MVLFPNIKNVFLDLRIDGNPNLSTDGKPKKASSVYIIVGVVAGAILAIAVVVTLYYPCSAKKKKRQSLQNASTDKSQGVDKTERELFLDWKTRLQIALGAAQGLKYLHVGCNPAIFHRDIKSSNTVPGGKLIPKVAVCRFAALFVQQLLRLMILLVGEKSFNLKTANLVILVTVYHQFGFESSGSTARLLTLVTLKIFL